MLEKIQDVLKSTQGITSSVVIILGLVFALVKFSCDKSELAEQNQNLQNLAADRDSLHSVAMDAQNANRQLKERLSYVEGENVNSHVKDALAKKRIAQVEGQLRTYIEAYQQAQLAIKRLEGTAVVRSDSIYGTYDSVDTYFTLRATAHIKPETFLNLRELTLHDTVSLGQYSVEEGYFTGFIIHTNPYIATSNAEFAIATDEIPGLGESSFGYRLGLGPVYDGKWTVAALVGIRYKSWGLTPFISAGTRGILLMKDF